SADVAGEGEGTCPQDSELKLYDSSGALLAVGSPGEAGGCSPIDPIDEEGARFMPEGSWTLCVSGFLDRAVSTYTLSVELGEDSCDLEGVIFPPDSDPDGDGITSQCDDDNDGDGVLDVDDNCPDVPNGPDMDPLYTDQAGWVKNWLMIGPFSGTETTEACRPSDEQLLGDDANATAQLGDAVGDLPWIAFEARGRRVNILDVYGGPTPRENYALVWLRSDTARSATLAIGPDDGARVWINGEEVIDISGCQGTNVDQFQSEVELLEGWNRVLVKVRDQGGGWGMFFRLLDGETAIEGLEVSLIDSAPWIDDQGDADGDGIGDLCDPNPAVP
ncbi:MAG: hypothetical protein QF464_12580, partial [Myxococcota bacterium]|nr:hypothetical protein [Myxococcota bacterium]